MWRITTIATTVSHLPARRGQVLVTLPVRVSTYPVRDGTGHAMRLETATPDRRP
jgi:hypothetical protein